MNGAAVKITHWNLILLVLLVRYVDIGMAVNIKIAMAVLLLHDWTMSKLGSVCWCFSSSR